MIGPALALFLAAAADPADPLAPAMAGKVQCYAPDTQRKSCASIGSFVRNPDGRIDNRTIARLAPSPLIVVDTTAPVTIKGGAVCGPFTANDIETAQFTIDGKAANERQVASIKDAMRKTMASLLDHEICTTLAPDGNALKAMVSVDGKRSPDLDQPMIWVSPQDGYHVAQ
jgi:hypothetical protein